MKALSQTQREDLRRAVREVLAAAPRAAFPADVWARRVAKLRILDFTPTAEQAAEALGFLQGLGQVMVVPDPLGATEHWQITAAGTLAHERCE